MTDMIYQLDDVRATLETTGGKGASLARLMSAGLPVPGGFHITTAAYRNFVTENGLQPRIMAALEHASPADPASLDRASEQIRSLFMQAQIPAAVADEIIRAYNSMPGERPAVAVRSSATAEDLPDLSFAGQQDTYLNVRGAEDVLEAARRCWASLWTARAISYRLQHNIDQGSVSLAVVVQALIPSDASGILFTANPLTGRRDQVVINAAWGLGEAVVGGLVSPDTLVVDKSSFAVKERVIADKQVMTVRVDGCTEEQPVPDGLRKNSVLDDQQAAHLARLGVQIEQLYNTPMDVEWGLAGGTFAILQARPITTLGEPEVELEVSWALPDPKSRLGRGSIIDLLPDPLTPLFKTLGMKVIEHESKRMYINVAKVKEWKLPVFETVNDYPYQNMNFPPSIMLRMVGVSVSQMGGLLKTGEERWRAAHERTVKTIEFWKRQPPEEMTAARLLEGARDLVKTSIDIYTTLQTGLIPSASTSELAFTQFYNRLVKRPNEPAAPVFLFGFESMPIRAEKALYDLAEWAKSRPELAGYLTDTPGVRVVDRLESGTAPAGVEEEVWQQWQARLQDYLDRFGAAIYDLDFSKPVPADDPAPQLETVRMYLSGRVRSPHERVQELSERREQATQAVLNRIGGLRKRYFKKLLKNAQRSAPLREEGLADVGYSYPLLRKLLRELGRRLVAAGIILKVDDIFWLVDEEADRFAAALDRGEAPASMAAEIEQRKAVWRAEKRLTPPPLLPRGAKLFGINFEKTGFLGDISQKGSTIKGIAGSAGRVTAPARVLHGPEDFALMQPGEVLVAAITTPAWTPLFAMASGIVTDVGGPLSHSSIVAREYGIPAVLGTGVGTSRIHSGQVITVDGAAGTVTLEDAEDNSIE